MPPEPTTSLEQLQKSIQTFNTIHMESESREKLWRYQDAFMQSLNSILADDECDDAKKLEVFQTTMAQYTAALTELFPKLLVKQATTPEDPLWKSQLDRYDQIEEVEKFNPYHDERGRFATASGYNTFTIRTKDPAKQHMADMAIAREKEREAAEQAAARPKVTFTPAKTKKEAVEYAQNELGFAKASYGRLNIDTVNHINEQIANIQAKYPEVKGTVSEITTWSSQNAYAACKMDADGKIALLIGTTQYGKGLDTIQKTYERDVEFGFHPKGTDHSAIITHEYGHVLAAVSTKQKLGFAAGDTFDGYADKFKYTSRIKHNEVEGEWVTTACETTGIGRAKIKSAISQYATRNDSETFAEAFAEVNHSPNPSKEALAIVQASGWYRN